MKTLPASKLAETLELENNSDFACYEYMLQSYINGNRSQMINLFNQLEPHDKEKFVWFLHNEKALDALRSLTISLI